MEKSDIKPFSCLDRRKQGYPGETDVEEMGKWTIKTGLVIMTSRFLG